MHLQILILARLFARPYSQDKTAPGIILRTSTDDPAQKARATVEETYNQIIADAQKAADLMNQSRGVNVCNQRSSVGFAFKSIFIYGG